MARITIDDLEIAQNIKDCQLDTVVAGASDQQDVFPSIKTALPVEAFPASDGPSLGL